jgi:hypothetical protein
VRTKARSVLRIETLRRGRAVAFARAGQPQAPRLHRLGRVAHVDDAIELIVVAMPGLEIGGAARHVHEFAVDEPQRMHSARMRSRRIEVRDALRPFGHRDVEQLEAGRSESRLLRLIRDRHRVAYDVERIRAHLRMGQLGLDHDPRRARIADVDSGEVLRRRLVREPQDAAAVACELHRHALADAAEAREVVMGEEAHVERQRLAAGFRHVAHGFQARPCRNQ